MLMSRRTLADRFNVSRRRARACVWWRWQCGRGRQAPRNKVRGARTNTHTPWSHKEIVCLSVSNKTGKYYNNDNNNIVIIIMCVTTTAAAERRHYGSESGRASATERRPRRNSRGVAGRGCSTVPTISLSLSRSLPLCVFVYYTDHHVYIIYIYSCCCS